MNAWILLQQLLIHHLTALHCRETGHPQLDDIGLTVEILDQLAERRLRQRGVILRGDGHAGDRRIDRRVEHRHFDARVGDALHQTAGVGRFAVRQNNAVVLLADRLINEVLEACIVAVAEKGADLKAQLAALLNGAGDKLRGVVVGAQVTDHRDAHRSFVTGDGSRHGSDRIGDGAGGEQADGQQRERYFFHCLFPG